MKKILVVDDDFQQRDLYFELFGSAGFEVASAKDGLDAWEKIQKDKPDLVFTGIIMPRMTGFELIDKIRNYKPTEAVPVIIFSHLGRPEDRKKAQTLALADFMVKGYDAPVEIVKKAKELLFQGSSVTKPPSSDEDERPGSAVL